MFFLDLGIEIYDISNLLDITNRSTDLIPTESEERIKRASETLY